jgi:hypothetical protein
MVLVEAQSVGPLQPQQQGQQEQQQQGRQKRATRVFATLATAADDSLGCVYLADLLNNLNVKFFF